MDADGIGARPAVQSPPAADFDPRRTLEFLKYYGPFIASISGQTPVPVDVGGDPIPGPDPTLTALCQLAALRLSAQRAVLSFFDARYQYVLAEATPFSSLSPSLGRAPNPDQDSLWTGYCLMPKALSICAHTLNLPQNLGSNQDSATAPYVHVINDLHQDARFCHTPYTSRNGPLRFYAAAPITTPSGITIGALCVMDAEPRLRGLSSVQVQALTDIAAIVFRHLDSIRASAEYERGTRMLAGLATFTQDMNGPQSAHATRPPDSYSSSHAPAVFSDERERGGHEQAAFRAAVPVVLKALDLHGICFYDTASFEKLGLLTKTSKRKARSYLPAEQQSLPARVWAEAWDTRNRSAPPTKPLSQSFLCSLVDTYERPTIFDLHDGETHGIGQPGADVEPGDLAIRQRLTELFPGVQRLGFVPVQNYHGQDLIAVAIFATYSVERVFSNTGELSFMTALCECIVAEIARREVQTSLQAKTAFMSAISHEVRTPLHGVLGSIEHLYAETDAAVTGKLLGTAESCARLLLGVLDNILDYADLQASDSSSGSLSPAQISCDRDPAILLHRPESMQGRTGGEETGLGEIVEEVLDATMVSYSMTRKDQGMAARDLRIQVDIDPSIDRDWTSGLTPGSWRRVCLNLINNAFKFTTEGCIAVSLSLSCDTMSPPTAVLEMEDTGCGVSPEFLNSQVFAAFAQEDRLTHGVGLGLNIVSTILKRAGASVSLQRRSGKGVRVTVRVPLTRHSGGPPRATLSYLALKEWLGAQQPPIGVVHREPCSAVPTQPQREASRDSFRALAEGLKLIGIPVASSNQLEDQTGTPAISSICEEHLPLWLAEQRKIEREHSHETQDDAARKAPLIVLCHHLNGLTNHELRSLCKKYDNGRHFEFLVMPCGPLRLAASVRACMAAFGVMIPDHSDTPSFDPHRSLPERMAWARHPFLDSAKTLRDMQGITKHPMRLSDQIDRILTSTDRMDNGLQIKVLESGAIVTCTTLKPGKSQLKRAVPKQNPRLTLLLVDDNHINLRLLETYCNKQGHQSLSATDGMQAVHLYQTTVTEAKSSVEKYIIQGSTIRARTRVPDAILLDVNMPIMDGFEAARRIRAFERSEGIPPALIIAMTGIRAEEARREALASGMDIFFPKPVKFAMLTKALSPLFANAQRLPP